MRSVKSVKQSTIKETKKNSMHYTQTMPMPVYKALMQYAKDKGFDSEQAVVRVWAIRCLEAAGYWPIKD